MGAFSGFPHRTEATAVPEVFFSEVLPAIEDLAELKVLLVALRRIRRQKGSIRWVSASDVVAAPEVGALSGAVAPDGREAAVRRGLAAAVARGVLLAVPLAEGQATETAYFLNDFEGRRAMERVRLGEVSLGLPPVPPVPLPESAPAEMDIFRLYEETMGRPVPGAALAEELKDAERDYPPDWLRGAFREAAVHEVRSWAYVRAILVRWREEGRSDGTVGGHPTEARYRAGKYGRVVRWR